MNRLTPEIFLKEIKDYLDSHEIDIETVNSNNIDYDNYEQLLWGNDIFDFRFGATRGCFIPVNNPSFVFKFDFDGLWEKYCATERDFYKDAITAGLEECFTKIVKFDTLYNVIFYKCEYADELAKINRYIDKQEIKMLLEETSKHHGVPNIFTPWAIDFINYYGLDIFSIFLDFLIAHGINDLHANNVGYIQGRPVVIDYAGYFEPSSE